MIRKRCCFKWKWKMEYCCEFFSQKIIYSFTKTKSLIARWSMISHLLSQCSYFTAFICSYKRIFMSKLRTVQRKRGILILRLDFPSDSKILITCIFQWLKLITKILNLLKVFCLKKSFSRIFNVWENLPENQSQKVASWKDWAFALITFSSHHIDNGILSSKKLATNFFYTSLAE